jgi:hypothetical protein
MTDSKMTLSIMTPWIVIHSIMALLSIMILSIMPLGISIECITVTQGKQIN